MAVFEVVANNSHDEIAQYQMGRYISTNEALWKIYSYPMYELFLAVVHLAVHFKNGQSVYFTNENVQERAARPPCRSLNKINHIFSIVRK
jgi:hypothetical protein